MQPIKVCNYCGSSINSWSPISGTATFVCGTYVTGNALQYQWHRSGNCLQRVTDQNLTHPLETLLGLIQEITINRHQRVSFSYEPGSHSLQVDIEGADKTRGRINVSLIHLRAARTPENNLCSNIMEASEYVRKEQREAGGR